VSTIVSTIQEIVRHELRGLRVMEIGGVRAVYSHGAQDDSGNYGCDVELRNSGLLLKRVPITTGHIGSAAVPNVGDLVVVGFEDGDVNQPIVLGRLYNDEDRPPVNTSDELIFRLPLAKADDKTIKGAIRNIAGNAEPREIIFELPPKITVRISEGNVRATAGKTELKLDQPDGGGGTVTVTTGSTKLVLNQDGDVAIEASQALSIKANTDLTLEALTVKIKGSATVDIEAGMAATLKGTGTTSVGGSGPTTLQGGVVSINGLTSFSP
jgi:phage baseplate assembly protein gpV